jgi:CRISPR/Cas system endoribonuclease Cas6 (RAMP superfamily)
MSILQKLEDLHIESSKENSPYILIGATVNKESQFADHIVFHTLSPLVYVGVYDILAEKLEVIREWMISEAQPKKHKEATSVLDVKLNEILDEEYENLKSGIISGDFNDSILNLVEKINKMKKEVKIDDILPSEEEGTELL